MIINVSINVNDADVSRVVHALCSNAGVPETVANAKSAIIQRVRETVLSVERNDAMNAAIVASTAIPEVVIT